MDIKYIENNEEGIDNFWEVLNSKKVEKRFKNIDEPKSPTFLLTGSWGIGKTHFIDDVISSKLKNSKWLFIDLLEESFGDNYLSIILESITKEIILKSKSAIVKRKIIDFAKKGAAEFITSKTGISFNETEISNKKIIDEINKSIKKKECLYIFLDNLERIHKNEQINFIKILSILSKISNLKITLITHKENETTSDSIGLEYIDKFINGYRFELVPPLEHALGTDIYQNTLLPELIRSDLIRFESGTLATSRSILREGSLDFKSSPEFLKNIYGKLSHEDFFELIWESINKIIEIKHIEFLDTIIDDYSDSGFEYQLNRFTTGINRMNDNAMRFYIENEMILGGSFEEYEKGIYKIIYTLVNKIELDGSIRYTQGGIRSFKKFLFELSKNYWKTNNV